MVKVKELNRTGSQFEFERANIRARLSSAYIWIHQDITLYKCNMVKVKELYRTGSQFEFAPGLHLLTSGQVYVTP